MAYIVPEPKNIEIELLDKASKLHLDAFSCWKETLHHYSTKLEILTYERDSLLAQLREMNEEKTKLLRQYREKLRSQMRRNNSLQGMINVLTQGSNDGESPPMQEERQDIERRISCHESETSLATSLNSEEDNLPETGDIVCIEMDPEEENTREGTIFSDHSDPNLQPVVRRMDDEGSRYFRNNVIVVSSHRRNSMSADECPTIVTTELCHKQSHDSERYSVREDTRELPSSSSSSKWIESREHCSSGRKDQLSIKDPVTVNVKEESDDVETVTSNQALNDIKESSMVEREVGKSGSSSTTSSHSVAMMRETDSMPSEESRPTPVEARPFFCKECGRWFDTAFKLRKHLSFHSSERPYKCGVCNKRFRLKHHLVEHTRVHTGYRPYRCTSCGKGFNRRGIAELHICSGRDSLSGVEPQLKKDTGQPQDNL